ncbi:MAG: hypothetical protein HQM14_14845 [SAR324 cluster bacterium]|nr:hypothetical protein [SAR324 cluster bacterium]
MKWTYMKLICFSGIRYFLMLLVVFFLSLGFGLLPASHADSNSSTAEDNVFGDEKNAFGGENAAASEAASFSMAADDNQIVLNGFLEIERGARVGESENHEETWVLANERVRLKTSKSVDKGGFDLKIDFVKDGITRKTEVDIREARLRYSPFRWMDLSIGKQVATWGVGDLIFINDLFPKNWVNLFTGRDIESLKDASNAVRITSYLGNWTWDVVWTPEFDPDSTPTGCRFSVFDPNQGMPVANTESCGEPVSVEEQNNKDENGEIAMRLKTLFGSQEVALYAYNGFWKNPKGLKFSPAAGLFIPFYPRLGVYGLSSEGQLGPGIVFFEAGHYRSYEDEDGTNPLIENSNVRGMVGYKYQFSADLTLSGQVMSEKMLNYDNYEDHVPVGLIAKDEVRNTVTLRLMQTAQQETLRMSFFVYHRPQHRDDYLRYWVNKRLDDHFDVTVGGNVFSGHPDYLDSEFGMLRKDDNAFVRVKYIF